MLSSTFSAKAVSQVMRYATKHFLHLQPTKLSLPKATDDKPRLLYIHIPFCHTLCPYCSFHKFPFDEQSALKYFELLHKEIRLVHQLGYKFDSIYFGGGTTTILPQKLLETIQLAKSLFDIKEISCESDPLHIADINIPEFHKEIDRLSIGIQSFNNEYLIQMGRHHKFGSAQEQFEKVKAILEDFAIVNVDIIYNYPSQSEAQIHEEIDQILKLRPKQVTFYPLMYAPNIQEHLSKEWGELNDKKEQKLYEIIQKRMGKAYTQRSSWAWSLEGDDIIDEYVIERSEYVGVGSGAFSFIGDTLYANTFSLPKYAELLKQEKLPITHAVSFPKRAIAEYRMVTELFGLHASSKHPKIEQFLLKRLGVYDTEGNVSQKGSYLMSVMMREFYNGMDYVRETMRKSLDEKDGLIVK
ncbi:coproporphyrinogen III oxidase family protein [Sulfurimonas sp.]|uniref:coproporphyrinogen III oxidase family protein n=1 Tax=Sulfurimonas sp. TaxID=2022749 RepID=UPI003D133FC1